MDDADAFGRAYPRPVRDPGVLLTDVAMAMVEWNGRLAETIVAQADQIVAMTVELRALREARHVE